MQRQLGEGNLCRPIPEAAIARFAQNPKGRSRFAWVVGPADTLFEDRSRSEPGVILPDPPEQKAGWFPCRLGWQLIASEARNCTRAGPLPGTGQDIR
jgi:hypothetical protein